MRGTNEPLIHGYRAMFGLGFLALGAVTLWRIGTVAVPPGNKLIGLLLAFAMIGLGIFRIIQYVRYRRSPGA